ncbi:MAG: hypothetical protein HY664_05020 [Chloroflexi bacterium]|nr:hypothetical protein [Chloroflexota bacterium]
MQYYTTYEAMRDGKLDKIEEEAPDLAELVEELELRSEQLKNFSHKIMAHPRRELLDAVFLKEVSILYHRL